MQRYRELVQPGHEDVDALAGAVVEGVGDVGVGGEVGGFQAGRVGGGEDGGVRVDVGRVDPDRTRGGAQLFDEEHVLGVRAVEPDGDGGAHGASQGRGERGKGCLAAALVQWPVAL
ncbi:hypothetical protein GCM10009639_67830 [Kitasatospora putterlickiae]|uniref:Uncharacterized protein n=1 Tax=Kitasatospora putterlickiae TaxID=221725 RepID=A0ABP4JAG8_9ACTN